MIIQRDLILMFIVIIHLTLFVFFFCGMFNVQTLKKIVFIKLKS